MSACSSDPEKKTPKEWLQENTTLLQQLRSYDAKERIDAINRFKEVGKKRGTLYALALLQDQTLEDYRIEVVLARILADWRDRRAIPFLLRHLFHIDASASDIAVEGLLVFRDDSERIVEALEDRISGPVTRERMISTRVLSRIGSEEVIDLFHKRYLHEPQKEIRAEFLMAIDESKVHPRQRTILIDSLTDGDPSLREFAWNALNAHHRLPQELEFEPDGDANQRAGQVARLRIWDRKSTSVARPRR
ncbi:MAG: hypothetical protein AAF517_16590 [Planctomycetota bacterium]